MSTTPWKMKLMGKRKDRMIREKIVSREKSGVVEESQQTHERMRMTHDA